MRRWDRAAVRMGVAVAWLMDQAGRAVAEAARTLARFSSSPRFLIISGGGHNGGDGIAAARWLRGWGFPVEVLWLSDPRHADSDVARHILAARKFGVRFRRYLDIAPRQRLDTLRSASVLIDAILGTGTHGPVRLDAADAIVTMNASRRPIVAVDLPSGLDPSTGRVHEIAVRARVTVTLGAAKKGLTPSRARRYTGRLIVADIGLPHIAPFR